MHLSPECIIIIQLNSFGQPLHEQSASSLSFELLKSYLIHSIVWKKCFRKTLNYVCYRLKYFLKSQNFIADEFCAFNCKQKCLTRKWICVFGNLRNYILTTKSFSLAITGRNLFSGNFVTMTDWLSCGILTWHKPVASNCKLMYSFLSYQLNTFLKKINNMHTVMYVLYSTMFFKNKSCINIYDNLQILGDVKVKVYLHSYKKLIHSIL